jgi:superfamily II DNA or RNA helicase/very-short-patch-repair endonuclease
MNNTSSPDSKIALFRNLFRGREDVYPLRFESHKTGRCGYQPACGNEWVKGVCNKGSSKCKVKCAVCSNRILLAVTDEVILKHLSGRDERGKDFVIGLYPMFLDETCLLLAVDFDKKSWQDDTRAFVTTCRKLTIPVAVERSRSGNGSHVWLFFSEPLPAAAARRLASHLITETMENCPGIGLDSYDRFIPNQDTLPRGGFGSLIALPLQKKPRANGNSLFLDDDLQPHADQWAFMASIKKISPSQTKEIIQQASADNRIIGVKLSPTDVDNDTPWLAAPSRRRKETAIADLPEKLEMTLGDQIYIPKQELSPPLTNRLLRIASFQNPEFYKAQAMRFSTFGTPRIIACAEDFPHHIGLPRGCLDEVKELFSKLKVPATINDERFCGTPLPVEFQGTLRPAQVTAARAMASHDTGVLSATTAFGKTVLAAWLIARRGVNTLVLVHRKQLLEQWIERLSTFLDMEEGSIGRIGGGQKDVTGIVDVAIIQSLVRKKVVNDLVADYGHLVVDECHHISATGFELVVRRAKAKYITGLSATVVRKDGHHPIIFMQCGPVRHTVEAKQEAKARPFTHSVIVRPTGFVPPRNDEEDERQQLHQLYRELAEDETRNAAICEDVLAAVKGGRSPLVLTERTFHLQLLAEQLTGKVKHLIILQGGMGRKKLRIALASLRDIPENEERVLLATGRYIGEGFDDQRLDTLFLTLPVSWKGIIAQYAGRLHRLHDRKREVRIYDYADLDIPMLARMFDRRCRGYEAIGYSIKLPASGLPGWPAEVELPTNPLWKQNYSASLRRLIRDGVDKPLASLFRNAARELSAGGQNVFRARSASEAFLYKRLSSMKHTADRFQLNVELPIPFDGLGKMEVDLLDNDARIAIEIDGSQHLDDADAYRRDRRKDQLLQENDYFVLRFLAEDIGQQLDNVLNAIERTLANRLKTGVRW